MVKPKLSKEVEVLNGIYKTIRLSEIVYDNDGNILKVANIKILKGDDYNE